MAEPLHPIDAEIRQWLKDHVPNQSELSVKIGHSSSWLHKYVNGAGHATIDDLVRIAGLLMGLNLPALTEMEQRLLAVIQKLENGDQQDVLAWVEHRVKQRAQRATSKGSSEPKARNHPGKARKER